VREVRPSWESIKAKAAVVSTTMRSHDDVELKYDHILCIKFDSSFMSDIGNPEQRLLPQVVLP
jgi:hypothetical protein